MSEAISLREQAVLEQVDTQAIEVGLQRIFFGLLSGTEKPETALAAARTIDALTRRHMLQQKGVKMTTKAPTQTMLRNWGIVA